jgi:CheY-like chemotaxis protein
MSVASSPSNRGHTVLTATVPPKGPLVQGDRFDEVCGMMATRGPRDISVLITDDDSSCRDALREIFEPEGYRTLLASSGEEALDIVSDAPVDVALLDMHMPRLTGLETLRLVRQINAVLPCILVTADATDGLIRQALHAHAYSVIAKPVSKHVVLYTVVRALVRAYGDLKQLPPSEHPAGGGPEGVAGA